MGSYAGRRSSSGNVLSFFRRRCRPSNAQVEYSVQPLTTVHLRRGDARLPRVRVLKRREIPAAEVASYTSAKRLVQCKG